MTEQSAETAQLPRAGETWKYLWLWAVVVKAGPKQVTYRTETRTGWETTTCPTDRFLARFRKVSLPPGVTP